MNPICLKFEGREFPTIIEMIETLLEEANERIVRIDLGEFNNDLSERNYIKFRLLHIQRSMNDLVPKDTRSIFNSVWTQLYRLEHQGNHVNPYLSKILEQIQNGSKYNSY